jgi:diguanylate cyclase (GGDEF)-like protein
VAAGRKILGTAAALLFLAGVGWLDYVTGPDYDVSLFYLLPVVACGLLIGALPAAIVASAASAGLFIANLVYHEGSYLVIAGWNGLTSLAIFVSMGLFTARLRHDRDALSSLNKRLEQLLQGETMLARTDSLTGLQNRRGFCEVLEVELARARRASGPVCLAYVDIDNFKNVNDLHGHAAGDEFLRQVGSALRDTIRGGDLAARLGGDEFGVLLNDVSLDAARSIAGRLLERLAELALAYPGCNLGASIGLAYCERTPDAAADFIAAADVAMYRAKDRGKAQVAVSVDGKLLPTEPPVSSVRA